MSAPPTPARPSKLRTAKRSKQANELLSPSLLNSWPTPKLATSLIASNPAPFFLSANSATMTALPSSPSMTSNFTRMAKSSSSASATQQTGYGQFPSLQRQHYRHRVSQRLPAPVAMQQTAPSSTFPQNKTLRFSYMPALSARSLQLFSAPSNVAILTPGPA
jgi:hypothetical protein